MATKTVVNKTTDYTITADDSGKIFTNEGASGAVVFTLPAAAAGLYYGFACKYTDSSKRFDIQLASGDKVIDNFSIEATYGVQTTFKGEVLWLYCVDSTYWVITNRNRWGFYNEAPPYGFFGAGYSTATSNIIDYITLANTTQNATDVGDLTVARNGMCGGARGAVYGFCAGGDNAAGVYYNTIDYITLATTVQNSADKGDLTVARDFPSGLNGSTYGFFGGGDIGSTYYNTIDYITLSTTTGNATDAGDLTVTRSGCSPIDGTIYGFFGGGVNNTTYYNTIDYITLATTTQNATDTGDLTGTRTRAGGVSDSTYGFFGGGWNGSTYYNFIEYIALATTTQNSTDTGDLTAARNSLSGSSGSIYGFFAGGYNGSARTNIIDYITLATTTQNATDTGDLSVARNALAGI